MSLSSEIIQLIVHARISVKELSDKYHNGGSWGHGLTGYCGIASRFMISLARRNGIYGMRLVCGTFDGMTHCWVEYNGFCIDLTITQFSGFQHKAYRISTVNGDFYRTHYTPAMIGCSAMRHQKQWEHGQNYESCATILWHIHKKNFIKEYNGVLFQDDHA